jgi:hypothetical protein
VILILIDTIAIEALLAASLDLFLVELASAAEAFSFLANARVLDVAAFLAAQAGYILLPALIAFGRIRIGLRYVKYMKCVNSYLY